MPEYDEQHGRCSHVQQYDAQHRIAGPAHLAPVPFAVGIAGHDTACSTESAGGHIGETGQVQRDAVCALVRRTDPPCHDARISETGHFGKELQSDRYADFEDAARFFHEFVPGEALFGVELFEFGNEANPTQRHNGHGHTADQRSPGRTVEPHGIETPMSVNQQPVQKHIQQ